MVYTAFCQTCGRTVYLGEDDTRACPVCSSPLIVSQSTSEVPPLDERLAKNEARARAFNENLEQGDRSRDHEGLVEFMCECGDATCRQTIRMSIGDYEEIRTDPKRFIVVSGHELEGAEIVVDSKSSFRVVEKVGRPGEIAEDLDDRN